MLHIILLILKIIGIVLLSILGILLLMIVCALFVPVRYRIRVIREAGEDEPPVKLYIKVTWLLHLANLLIRYPSEVIVRARILIFTLFRVPGKERKTKRADKRSKSEKSNRYEESTYQEESIPQDKSTHRMESIPQDKSTQSEVTAHKDESEYPDYGMTQEKTGQDNDSKKSFFAIITNIIGKIKQIVEKIKAFFQNIQYTIRKFCDKIRTALDNIQYYREVFESDPFRQSMRSCRDELGWVLKKLKPDKFEADFIVGMEDPSTTGEILAIHGMLYPLIGQHVRLVGDFECDKMHIEGRLYIRGKIRAFTFLRVAARIYFNKDIKKLIKLLKKEAV